MSSYNHIDYCKDIAENLKTIAHTKGKPRFFISTGLAALDGLVAHSASANLPCIVAEDGCDERIYDNTGDNPISIPFYTIYVLFKASPGNDSEVMGARKNARVEAKKIVARMYSDYLNQLNGLALLDPNSIRLQGVGPLGDFGHGVMITFTLQQAAGITYNPNDWLDESGS